MKREGRLVITSLVIAAMVAPAALDADSFPLSTYPMYAFTRSSESTLATAIGRDVRGEERPLTLDVIGASDDPLIVAGELRAAIAAGRADEQCRHIAKRASSLDGIVDVEVVVERRDTVAHVSGLPSLRSRRVEATCVVPSTADGVSGEGIPLDLGGEP